MEDGLTEAAIKDTPISSSGHSRAELNTTLGERYSAGQPPLARGAAALGAGLAVQIPIASAIRLHGG